MPELVLTEPRARGLFILTAHPLGCRALASRQIERARMAFAEPLAGAQGKTAFVLGSTTFGYGSSIAIALRAAGFERVIGLGYETPPTFRKEKVALASPGWFLTRALHEQGVIERSYLADAFADETRDRVIADLLAERLEIDLLVYSIAAPRRSHLGETWSSALKVVGEPLEVLGLDFRSGEHKPVRLEPASELEVEHTRRVMGGDDLDLWVNALLYAGCAAEGMTVAALSYIGPSFEVLRRLYWDGALGAAKKHIDATTRALDARLTKRVAGRALSVMNPAVVTGASVAIPAMLKYIADYLGVVEEGTGRYDDPLDVGIHFSRALYGEGEVWRQQLDEAGRLRLDQHELAPELQAAVQALWADAKEGPAQGATASGLARFRREYHQLFGWQVPGVDYGAGAEFSPELGPAQGVYDLIEM